MVSSTTTHADCVFVTNAYPDPVAEESKDEDNTEGAQEPEAENEESQTKCGVKISIEDMVKILSGSQELQNDEGDGSKQNEAPSVYESILSSVPQFASGELHQFINELDANQDGMITEDELKRYFYLVKLFHLCDQDNSGSIKHGELLVAMRDHADKFPESFVQGDATRVGGKIYFGFPFKSNLISHLI